LAHILAVEAFLKTAGGLPCSVKFLLDGEEESGSPSLAALVEANKGLLACDIVYFADGPIHYSGRPQVIFGCRGVLDVEIEIRDNVRDCHSGHFGGVISNPAWKMTHLLTSMCTTDGEALVEGFYDGVRRITEAEAEALRSIPFEQASYLDGVGIPEVEGRDPVDTLKRIMFRPTMTVAGLASGHTGAGMRTIVPCRAVSKLDMRLVADQDPDQVFDCIVKHVKARVPGAQVSSLGKMYPSRTSMDLPVSKAIVGAVRSAWGMEPVVLPSTGASCPDYVFTRILGVPSVMVPYANVDESNHGPNENISIDLFMKGIQTSVHAMEAIGVLRE
ncbi:MAG: M20/M25/M40 family metallo-hydrolase, partial [Bacillota bacterium]